MRNTVMIPALLALSVGLAACSHQPNVNLENAKSNYSALQTNPEATKVAALETKDAGEWLDKAEKAYLDKEKESKEYYSYNRFTCIADFLHCFIT